MDINKTEVEFVKKYKIVASDARSHPELIKNVAFLEMLVVSLASPDLTVAKLALETVHILIQNRLNHSAVCSTYGILEAVKYISERFSDENITLLANQILYVLTGPSYGTRSNKRKQQQLYGEQKGTYESLTKQVVFYIHGLCKNNQKNLEEVLIQQKGVVSLHMNVNKQTCTLRVLKNVSPRILAELIFNKMQIELKLVIKSPLQKEVLVSLVNNEESGSNVASYLPEEDSPVKNRAVSMLGQWKTNASGMIQWFQKSFYW